MAHMNLQRDCTRFLFPGIASELQISGHFKVKYAVLIHLSSNLFELQRSE